MEKALKDAKEELSILTERLQIAQAGKDKNFKLKSNNIFGLFSFKMY